MLKLHRDFWSGELPAEDSLDGQKVSLIRTLLSSLPADVRRALIRELTVEAAVAEAKTPTGVLATVLKLVPKGETVTAAELREHVEGRGLHVHPKEIYNAIGYLSRTGALKRIGYGRYTVDGVEISTSDNLGGERDRHEDLSDD